MMKKLFIQGAVVALTALTTTLTTPEIMAQEKRTPTLEDLIPGGESYRYAENIYGLQWWGDHCIRPTEDGLTAINPVNGQSTTLFTLKQVNEALKAAGLKPLQHLYSLRLPWSDETVALLPLPQRYALYN